MPANSEILPRYKSYVGRTFMLRQHKDIYASVDREAKSRRKVSTDKVFGEACLVFDESNTRVKVTTLDGKFLWISKFYLHKELTNGQFQNHDYVVDLSAKLLDLSGYFKFFLKRGDEDENVQLLQDAATALRQHADDLNPKNSK